ncbi:hypothetical protein BN13_310001 [Nostocoides jenkinsii Ben 74]|uniref:Uncharacterized protein n=1 Tax=Nostocoides jenkinsii Ben 74 TaxID=1193518 RepID=A0A077MEA5_9MICO|nr:hypothetical protein BN13_310001 [Tetrasphaera jenkinsii Ben 74]
MSGASTVVGAGRGIGSIAKRRPLRSRRIVGSFNWSRNCCCVRSFCAATAPSRSPRRASATLPPNGFANDEPRSVWVPALAGPAAASPSAAARPATRVVLPNFRNLMCPPFGVHVNRKLALAKACRTVPHGRDTS